MYVVEYKIAQVLYLSKRSQLHLLLIRFHIYKSLTKSPVAT